MNVEIWPAHGPLNSKDVFAKFIKSLRRSGEQVYENVAVPNADVAVIWSVLWQGRMRNYKEIWDRYRKANKPVIVIEVGGIKRNETWKIGINGVNREADFGNQIVDDQRWNMEEEHRNDHGNMKMRNGSSKAKQGEITNEQGKTSSCHFEDLSRRRRRLVKDIQYPN